MAALEQNSYPIPRRAHSERALVLLAYFMELDGDAHLPLFEKFESELAELKRPGDGPAGLQDNEEPSRSTLR